MNFITPAKPAYLPIQLIQPATRPVAPVANNETGLRDASQRSPSSYVYRGDLLDEVPGERRYHPGFNLQISPQNQRAIATYQLVDVELPALGLILDGFV